LVTTANTSILFSGLQALWNPGLHHTFCF